MFELHHATTKTAAIGLAGAIGVGTVLAASAVETSREPATQAGQHHRALQLTAGEFPLGNSGDAIWAAASNNLDQIETALQADPDPVGTVIGELFNKYTDLAQSSLQDSLDGLEGIWSGYGKAVGLEALLPLVQEQLDAGNTTAAFNLINNDFLYDMKNTLMPLFSHEVVEHSGVFTPGLFSIPSEMIHDFGNLSEVFADYNFWKHAVESFTSPLIGMQFAISDATNVNVPDGFVAQDPLDALLNGYVPWASASGDLDADPHRPLIGLLTEGGPIDYFFRQIPDQIAVFLEQGVTDSAADSIPDGTEAVDTAASILG